MSQLPGLLAAAALVGIVHRLLRTSHCRIPPGRCWFDCRRLGSASHGAASVWAKLEFQNPGGSVRDRIAQVAWYCV